MAVIVPTRELALETLLSFQPADIFRRAYFEEVLPENLDFYFKSPDPLFGDALMAEQAPGLIPILDDGNFDRILYVEPATRRLLWKPIERLEDTSAVYENWNQYLGSLAILMAETHCDDDNYVRRLAQMIGFDQIDETIAFLDGTTRDSYDAYQEKQTRFLRSLTG